MNQLFTIAEKLGEIARQRYAIKQAQIIIERSLKRAEINLIPEGGWPGKNETERKTAEANAKFIDPTWNELTVAGEQLNNDMAKQDMEREVLLAERDAWTWSIRDRETQYDSHRPFDMSIFQAKALYDDDAAEQEAYAEFLKAQAEDQAAADAKMKSDQAPMFPGLDEVVTTAKSSDDPNDPNYVPF